MFSDDKVFMKAQKDIARLVDNEAFDFESFDIGFKSDCVQFKQLEQMQLTRAYLKLEKPEITLQEFIEHHAVNK